MLTALPAAADSWTKPSGPPDSIRQSVARPETFVVHNGPMTPALAALAPIGPSTSSAVNVLLGNGDGSFQTFVPYLLHFPDSFTGPIGIAIRDLNGDGKADLAVTPLYATLQVLLGN